MRGADLRAGRSLRSQAAAWDRVVARAFALADGNHAVCVAYRLCEAGRQPQ